MASIERLVFLCVGHKAEQAFHWNNFKIKSSAFVFLSKLSSSGGRGVKKEFVGAPGFVYIPALSASLSANSPLHLPNNSNLQRNKK